LRSSRRIPSRVAPRPGEGSVAASIHEGFVMLETSMTKGCDGVLGRKGTADVWRVVNRLPES
jgi:hypothetical protein